MPDLSSRNKVPFVSLSHFNGLAGTQRLGLPSRPKAARNSLAKLVMDTRVAFSYLLAGRGLVCPAGASRCGPIHNAGEGEACAQTSSSMSSGTICRLCPSTRHSAQNMQVCSRMVHTSDEY